MKDINVAIAGTWAFHTEDFVERNRRIPGCHMTAVWDQDISAGKAFAEKLNLKYYERYDDLLVNPEIDAVLITAATRDHADLAIRTAQAHKHMLVEKAPMLTAAEGKAVCQAVKEAGVHYVFSDPVLKPEAQQLKRMMQEGVFGQVIMMTVRHAHNMGLSGQLPDRFFHREEAGGGVAIDLGCHGIHMLHWFFGMPNRCVAASSCITDRAKASQVEDNASVTFRFENDVIGVTQSGWAGGGMQNSIDLYGTKGCAHAFGGQVHYALADKVWHTLTKTELPPDGMKPMNMFLDTLINGVSHPEYGVDEAAQLAAMIEMARNALK